MKRIDIIEVFPEATKEQIDKLLGIASADLTAKNSELENLKAQLEAAKKPNDELQKAQQKAQELQTELDKMKAAETIRLTREKVAGEKKIPASLLTGETEEDCAKQADAILAFAKPGGYPNIPDGGEPHGSGGQQKTRVQFADWFKDAL